MENYGSVAFYQCGSLMVRVLYRKKVLKNHHDNDELESVRTRLHHITSMRDSHKI